MCLKLWWLLVFYQSTIVESTKVMLKKSKDMLKKSNRISKKILSTGGRTQHMPLDCKDYTCTYVSGVYYIATVLQYGPLNTSARLGRVFVCAGSTAPLPPTHPRSSCERNLSVLGEGKTLVFSVSTSVSHTESLKIDRSTHPLGYGYNFCPSISTSSQGQDAFFGASQKIRPRWNSKRMMKQTNKKRNFSRGRCNTWNCRGIRCISPYHPSNWDDPNCQ